MCQNALIIENCFYYIIAGKRPRLIKLEPPGPGIKPGS